MQYNTVTNLTYADFEQTRINCSVDFTSAGILPFTADKNDPEPHGREIFERAVAGDFGAIEDYQPPPEMNTIPPSDQQRSRRNQILESLDQVVTNPLRWAELTQSQQQDYARYRQELLDVPQQANFPNDISWPTPPNGFAPPAQVTVDISSFLL
jgi:hypothetical protein